MNRRLKERLRHLLPRSLGRHRILAGPLRGNVLVTSWHDYPGAILGQTERPLLEWFGNNVCNGETWLDIGAHYGYTALALSKLVGPAGRVYAFEPMLNTAGSISRTSSLNNLPQLTVVPMALGNCADLTIDSLQSVRGMLGQVFEENNLDQAQANKAVGDATDFKFPFLSSRLDWLWPRICGPDQRIDGVKIDVQGMEIEVLEGMATVAKRHHPKLLVELHRDVSRSKVLDVIASMGYVPHGVAVEPLPGESDPVYADDRTYLFTPTVSEPIRA